jgi:hypothetical protein
MHQYSTLTSEVCLARKARSGTQPCLRPWQCTSKVYHESMQFKGAVSYEEMHGEGKEMEK